MAGEQVPEVDFLVIGSGIAGMRAAIELASAGRVLLTSKGDLPKDLLLNNCSIYCFCGRTS
jgi:glycine/D-amino acid oxidase-like deaminating enzyme